VFPEGEHVDEISAIAWPNDETEDSDMGLVGDDYFEQRQSQ